MKKLKVLIVEDNKNYANLESKILSNSDLADFQISVSSTLTDTINLLGKKKFDVILLDLNLPDSGGMNTLLEVMQRAPTIPVVVMTVDQDSEDAVNAVKLGAQDFITKESGNEKILSRALLYAVERQRTREDLKSLTLIDGLTGIYNLNGFLNNAEKYMKLVKRKKENFLVAFIDVDNLKNINDTYGHQTGSSIISKTAEALKLTFRESDIIARFGGDEFIVIIKDATESDIGKITKRLKKNILKCNNNNDSKYHIDLSVGFSIYKHNDPRDLDDLIKSADKSMYEDKRKKDQLKYIEDSDIGSSKSAVQK